MYMLQISRIGLVVDILLKMAERVLRSRSAQRGETSGGEAEKTAPSVLAKDGEAEKTAPSVLSEVSGIDDAQSLLP